MSENKIKNEKGLTVEQIVDALNEQEFEYFGVKPRAWNGSDQSRIYFGRDYATIQGDTITNSRKGAARAITIGDNVLEHIATIVS